MPECVRPITGALTGGQRTEEGHGIKFGAAPVLTAPEEFWVKQLV